MEHLEKSVVLAAHHVCAPIHEHFSLVVPQFSVAAGEFVGIVGPNGAGKSTLLKALGGLLTTKKEVKRSLKEAIFVKGKALSQYDAKELAKELAFMPQNTEINFEYTVKELIMTARYPYLKWYEDEGPNDEAIVDEVLRFMQLEDKGNATLQELSGGERQRVFLAKALAQETDILLLDEPTASLDFSFANEIFEYGRTLCKKGKTILVVVHDLELASKFCSRLVLVDEGHILADGSVETVLDERLLSEAFHVPVAVYKDEKYPQMRIYVKSEGDA